MRNSSPASATTLAIIGGAVVAILVVVICRSNVPRIVQQPAGRSQQAGTATALKAPRMQSRSPPEHDSARACHCRRARPDRAGHLGRPEHYPPGRPPPPRSRSRTSRQPTGHRAQNPLFTGRLLAASPDTLGAGFVPIVEIPLDGSPARSLVDGRGRAPAISPQGDHMISARYSSARVTKAWS